MAKKSKTLEDLLRAALGKELRRRHGYGVMDEKIKPVHIANGLIRKTHGKVGVMKDVEHLMTATAGRIGTDAQKTAVERLIERSRDRWGRLGEQSYRDALERRVLPLLRRLLATDGATFGASPEMSSFSVPSARLATGDPSDDHAGELVHRLWSASGEQPEVLIGIVRRVTAPEIDGDSMDDLTAVLAPLSEGTRDSKDKAWDAEDLAVGSSSVVASRLRAAAQDLERLETDAKFNPIATLQRIVLLGSLSVFFHAATRGSERGGRAPVPLLVDESRVPSSAVAEASEVLVSRVMAEARSYLGSTLADLLAVAREANPQAELNAIIACALCGSPDGGQAIADAIEDLAADDHGDNRSVATHLLALLDGSSARGLPGFIRMLGLRTGLLYPMQKNPRKRVIPTDRTLEVLVVSSFDVTGRPLEYREFLDAMHARWGIISGGRLEDASILEQAGVPVGSYELTENGERFLDRLESIGLARRFADSVAMVGLFGGGHDGT